MRLDGRAENFWRAGHRRRALVGALLIGGLAQILAFGPSIAAAQSSATGPDAAGWVTYGLPSGVKSSLTTQHMIQGEPNSDGCSFSFAGSFTAGSPGIEEDEVAFNPSTCQAVYATGPVQHVASDVNEGTSSSSGSGPSRGTVTSATTSLAADPTKAYFLRTWYEDPLGIDVTSLRNDVEWSYVPGVCNTSYKWKRHATWYTTTDWYLQAAGDQPSFTCGNAQSNSHADMANGSFCAPLNTTYTHYYYTHYVWGGYNGNAHYGWHDEKVGPCSTLLSHHYSVGWETPW